MKKSSKAVLITVVITILLGAAYIGTSYYLRYYIDKNNSKQSLEVDGTQNSDDTISFGEIKYTLEQGETITAKYTKLGQFTQIYSLYPVSDKSRYDISPNGGVAVYLGKDNNIWALYNDGSSKKITYDKYDSIDKADMEKKFPGYIWAQNPSFISAESIRFVSDLPESSGSGKKSIWEANLTKGTMRMVYTPLTDSYKYLGYREDGSLLIVDGDSIAVINMEGTSVASSINVKDKYIVNMSPDGTKILYFRKNSSGSPDYSVMYSMDADGKNSRPLSYVLGYKPTDMGAWHSNDTQYAFIVKSDLGASDAIAVASFDEDGIHVQKYKTDSDIKFPENSKLRWAGDNMVSVDIGDDVLTVNLD